MTPDIIFIKKYQEMTTKYVSRKHLKKFLSDNSKLIEQIKIGGFISKYHNKCLLLIKNIEKYIDKKNKEFVDKELKINKEYFDNIFKSIDSSIKLDEEQRRAILTEEDYMMIIAGAGSGKTTTMAAKVKYLVEKMNIDPKEILMISYTNKACDELKEKLNFQFKIPVKIETFHKFGIEILKANDEKNYTVMSNSYPIISEYIINELGNNKELMQEFLNFFIYYFDIPTYAMKFKNINEYHNYKRRNDFITLKDRIDVLNKDIIDTRIKNRISIRGEFLKSSEEVMIANFLYLNGIEYDYERSYSHRTNNTNQKPDFTLYYNEKIYYLEHFGVDKNGYNKIFGTIQSWKYNKQIMAKRKMHNRFHTILLETYSGSDLLNELSKTLTNTGIMLNPRSDKEIFDILTTTGKDNYYVRFIYFCMNFISSFKVKGYTKDDFRKLKIESKDNERNILFLNFIEKLYNYYEKKMLISNYIDFEDMISKTYEMLCKIDEKKINLNYKYIIIDEYQDISMQRFNLTKKVSELSDAKVIAVGDDWQAIFAFAGSDVSLFTEFKRLMGYGEELQITHTYRNSQELIDIAGSFVMKNSHQIIKRLKSNKQLSKPVKIYFYDDTYKIMRHKVDEVNNALKDIFTKYGDNQKVLLVGRYNFDIYHLTNTDDFKLLDNNKIKSNNFPNMDITFLSAHTSKGLGFDQVIIINTLEGVYGFPSQIKNDEILDLVATKDNTFTDAEERRLFYVALTRTKNNVYLISPITNTSSFVHELLQFKDIEVINKTGIRVYNPSARCPKCGGILVKRHNEEITNYYECSNEKELCDFSTNNLTLKKRIKGCPKCGGYLIVKKRKGTDHYFLGCTNYNKKGCNYTEDIR